MTDAEAYSLFVKGLKPDLRCEIGTWVQTNDLDNAKAIALKADAYTMPQGKDEKKKEWDKGQRRGSVANVEEGETKKENKKQGKKKLMNPDEVNALLSKKKKKREKERNQAENERNRERNAQECSRCDANSGQNQRDGQGACFWCKGPHHVAVCPVIKQMREAAQSGASTSQQQGNA